MHISYASSYFIRATLLTLRIVNPALDASTCRSQRGRVMQQTTNVVDANATTTTITITTTTTTTTTTTAYAAAADHHHYIVGDISW